MRRSGSVKDGGMTGNVWRQSHGHRASMKGIPSFRWRPTTPEAGWGC